MLRLTRTLPALFAALAASSAAGEPCEPQATMVTEFGRHVPWGRVIAAGETRRLSEADTTRYLRVQLKAATPTSSSWSLVIRDVAGRPLQSIGPQQLPAGMVIWTDRLPRPYLELQVEADNTAGPVIETLSYVAMPSTAARPYYSVQVPGNAAWKDLYSAASEIRPLGDSIGMLVASEGNAISGVQSWTCSGVVIATNPDVLFVTNEHCGGVWADPAKRWTKEIVDSVFVDFSWDADGIDREYKATALETRSIADDLAILRLVAARPEAPPRRLPIRKARMDQDRDSLMLIHHPAAETKKVSLACRGFTDAVAGVSTVDQTRDFAHRCDTEAGSSGSPVLDEKWQIIGIHHLGFEKLPNGQCDRLNKAVHAQKLIDLLAANPRLKGYTVIGP
jgi:hypothetical protein